MEMSGVLELNEKTSSKGNPFFSVKVEGNYVGNAFDSVVKGFKTGDYVKVSYEEKGGFKNVLSITEEEDSDVTKGEFVGVKTVPYPKGYEPHPFVINEKSFYLAQLFVNGKEETTKKSLMKNLATTFELAKTIREFLLTGNTPAGIELLTED